VGAGIPPEDAPASTLEVDSSLEQAVSIVLATRQAPKMGHARFIESPMCQDKTAAASLPISSK